MSRACPRPRSGEFSKAVMMGIGGLLGDRALLAEDERSVRIPTTYRVFWRAGWGEQSETHRRRALTVLRRDPLREVALDRYTANLSRMVTPWRENWKARWLQS